MAAIRSHAVSGRITMPRFVSLLKLTSSMFLSGLFTFYFPLSYAIHVLTCLKIGVVIFWISTFCDDSYRFVFFNIDDY